MDLQTKQQLFEDFLLEWGNAYKKATTLFLQLANTPKGKKLLHKHSPFLKEENFDTSQLEWVSLIPQFDNVLEQIFFKPYWLPVQLETYELYLDLSDPLFPLFTIDYFWLQPYKWYKKPICSNLFQLLYEIENPDFSVSNKLKEIEILSTEAMNNCINNRKELGFAGELDIEAWESEDIFDSENLKINPVDVNTLEISGCNARIFCFLPLDMPITAQDFLSLKSDDDEVPEEVKTISGLCYFIEHTGVAQIHCLSIIFDNAPSAIGDYTENTFYLHHKDPELIKQFKDKVVRMIDRELLTIKNWYTGQYSKSAAKRRICQELSVTE